MSVLELSLAAAALLDRAHRGLVAVRVLDGGDDRARGRRRAGAGRRSPPAPPSLRARCSAAWPPSASLSALGDAIHGAGGRLAYLVAAAIAVAAAAAEARGMRIVPQIRRQLPEGWRWTMPLPLAAGPLRDPARARVHHLRAQLRRLGAGGDQRRPRRSRARARDRRGVRGRPGHPGRRGRAARGHARSGSGASS